ncbi:MAG: hypothetical protein JJ863_34750 [Deltaproteobacteria bacterium]|nr:hypothetical protein [Deltaproteobacteria bacterium]
MTIYMVASIDHGDTGTYDMLWSNSGQGASVTQLYRHNGYLRVNQPDGGNHVTSTDDPSRHELHVIAFRVEAGGMSTLWLDGVEVAETSFTHANTVLASTLGCHFDQPDGSTSTSCAAAYITHFSMYEEALDKAVIERDSRELRLRNTNRSGPDLVSSGMLVNLDAEGLERFDEGEAVGTWTDPVSSKSASQAEPAEQPVLTYVGRHPTVRFDGQNDSMGLTSIGDHTDYTLFIVGRRDAAGGDVDLFWSNSPGLVDAEAPFGVDEEKRAQLFTDQAGSSRVRFLQTESGVPNNATDVTPSVGSSDLHVFAVRVTGGAETKLYVDRDDSTTRTVAHLMTNLDSTLGAAVDLGPTDDIDSCLLGEIAQVVMYDRALTDAEMTTNLRALHGYYDDADLSGLATQTFMVPRGRSHHHHGHDHMPCLAPGSGCTSGAANVFIDTSFVTNAGGSGGSLTWSQLEAYRPVDMYDVVVVEDGVTLTYDVDDCARGSVCDDGVFAIVVDGHLKFHDSISTSLRIGTLMIREGGALTISNTDPSLYTRIVFDDHLHQPIDGEPMRYTIEPRQFTLGLVTSGGTVNIEGAPIYSSRGVISASLGSNQFEIDGDFGFESAAAPAVPLELFVTNSGLLKADPETHLECVADDHESCEIERTYRRVTASSIVPGTSSTTISIPWWEPAPEGEWDAEHWVGRHIAFLSRNVTFESADASQIQRRGHVLFGGNSEVNIEHAGFVNLGRTTTTGLNDFDETNGAGTNQRARYPLHFHHIDDAGAATVSVSCDGEAIDVLQAPKFTVDGASIILDSEYEFPDPNPDEENGFEPRHIKWGFVQHDCHGDITDSVCVGATGACFTAESGTETGIWSGNISITTGGGDLDAKPHHRREGCGQPTPLIHDHGSNGYAYWLRGSMVLLRDNVAAGVFGTGFSYDVPNSECHEQTIPSEALDGAFAETAGAGYVDPGLPAAAAGHGLLVGKDYYCSVRELMSGSPASTMSRRLANHGFHTNTADGFALRTGLFENWYVKAPTSIVDSTFILRGWMDISEANAAVIAYYAPIDIYGSKLVGHDTGETGDTLESYVRRTRGLFSNHQSTVRFRLYDSLIEEFDVGIQSPPTSVEIHGTYGGSNLTLRNVVNVLVHGIHRPRTNNVAAADGSFAWNWSIFGEDAVLELLDAPNAQHVEFGTFAPGAEDPPVAVEHAPFRPLVVEFVNTDLEGVSPAASPVYFYGEHSEPAAPAYPAIGPYAWTDLELSVDGVAVTPFTGLTNAQTWSDPSGPAVHLAHGGYLAPTCTDLLTDDTDALTCTEAPGEVLVQQYAFRAMGNPTPTLDGRFPVRYAYCTVGGDGRAHCGSEDWVIVDASTASLCQHADNGQVINCEQPEATSFDCANADLPDDTEGRHFVCVPDGEGGWYRYFRFKDVADYSIVAPIEDPSGTGTRLQAFFITRTS